MSLPSLNLDGKIGLVTGTGSGLGRGSGYAGLFATGFFGAGVLVGTQALIQKMVPNRYRGRVLGVRRHRKLPKRYVSTN